MQRTFDGLGANHLFKRRVPRPIASLRQASMAFIAFSPPAAQRLGLIGASRSQCSQDQPVAAMRAFCKRLLNDNYIRIIQ
jgi:hypothetical protein